MKSYTSGEAAKLCGLGLTTIKRWVKRGALKAYHTPGGDLRILHGHLLDFMRAYDIPLFDLQASQTVVLATDTPELGQLLMQQCNLEALKICCVNEELALGYALATERPDYIVIEHRAGQSDLARCTAIRKILAPHAIRIGLVGVSQPSLGSDRAEVITDTQQAGWEAAFLQQLFGMARAFPALLRKVS